jgi:hypothetical protein
MVRFVVENAAGASVLFTVAPENVDFTIDYAPGRHAHCIAPEEGLRTS